MTLKELKAALDAVPPKYWTGNDDSIVLIQVDNSNWYDIQEIVFGDEPDMADPYLILKGSHQ